MGNIHHNQGVEPRTETVRLQDQLEKAQLGKNVHLDFGMMCHCIAAHLHTLLDSSDRIIPFVKSFSQ